MPTDPKKAIIDNIRKDITDLRDSLQEVEKMLEFKIEELEKEAETKN